MNVHETRSLTVVRNLKNVSFTVSFSTNPLGFQSVSSTTLFDYIMDFIRVGILYSFV